MIRRHPVLAFVLALWLCAVVAGLILLFRRPFGADQGSDGDEGRIAAVSHGDAARVPTARRRALARQIPRFGQKYKGRGKAHAAAETLSAELEKIWANEQRDPDWAPKMEQQIASRLDASAARTGLKTTRHQVECRASSCRVITTTTKEDVLFAQEQDRESPRDMVLREAGGLGTTTQELIPKDKLVAFPDIGLGLEPDGSFKATTFVAFDDEEMDPDGYQERAEIYKQFLEEDIAEAKRQEREAEQKRQASRSKSGK